MAKFTIRVELHDADWEDYEKLYEELEKIGITDTFRFSSTTYKLPPAEYYYEGVIGCSDLRDQVSNVAKRVIKSYAVFVTEATARAWIGLKTV